MSTIILTNKQAWQNMMLFALCLLIAAGLTIFELVHRPKPVVAKVQAKIETVKPTPPPPTTVVRKAKTNAQVYIRSGKGTNSSIVALLDPGTEVTLGADADANWQEVTVGKYHGYIFKQYLTYE